MKELDWDRIQEIYHEALKLPPSERRAFIAKVTNQYPALMHEVNELVSVGDSLGNFLDTPIVELPVSPPPDNLVGTKIKDRYLIERELGHGGMGQLYLASDQNVNGRSVVIKFLLRELLEDAYAFQKFKQESKALSLIHHPNVVEVLDTGDLPDGRPYFVMQYVDGETLDQRIPQQGMPLEHAASILKQMGAALEHVHGKGVFHRDLKPTNIMLRRGTDSVVLVDFGIAKVINPSAAATAMTQVSPGTLKYMSPEQLQSEEITATSDIYSMGVIAFEMVTGRRPFDATSREKLLEQQRTGVDVKPTVFRRDLPPKAQDAILKALSFEPAARYQNAKQFSDNLAHALMDSTGNGTGRWPYVLLILLGVALLSFGAYKYLNRSGGAPPNRSFSYFLTVQRTHDGQPYRDRFKSHGEETFENGDKFRLTVTTTVPAYFYIFNEGPPEGDATFKMIFPRQATNNRSASVGADQSVETEWFTFGGPAGAENFWIVWSTSPVDELESARKEAEKHPLAALTGDTLVRVKQYLTSKEAEINATTYNYNGNQSAVVRARRDLLIVLAQFKHR